MKLVKKLLRTTGVILIVLSFGEIVPAVFHPSTTKLFNRWVEEIIRARLDWKEIQKAATKENIYWATLNAYHEARGEGALGVWLVMEVVWERVQSDRFPNTIVGVIQDGGEKFHRCQFTWWCDKEVDEVDLGDKKKRKKWLYVERLVRTWFQGEFPDVGGGAVFYFAPSVVKNPCWATDKNFVRTHNGHKFYTALPWEKMKELCAKKPRD